MFETKLDSILLVFAAFWAVCYAVQITFIFRYGGRTSGLTLWLAVGCVLAAILI